VIEVGGELAVHYLSLTDETKPIRVPAYDSSILQFFEDLRIEAWLSPHSPAAEGDLDLQKAPVSLNQYGSGDCGSL